MGTPIEVDGANPQAITVTWQSVQGQNAQGTLQGEPILANNADIYPINEVMFRHRLSVGADAGMRSSLRPAEAIGRPTAPAG